MATNGIEIHNWVTMTRFFQALGYELERETDHRPCQLRRVLHAADAVEAFQPTHWDTREMTIRDPDGRLRSLQAPAAS